MGTSYDAWYSYGLWYPDDDAESGWPEATLAILDTDDFDEWLARTLNVPAWDSGVPYVERANLLEKNCIERFGVKGFDHITVGYTEYPAGSFVHVSEPDAFKMTDGAALVPAPPDEATLERWKQALLKLSKLLPGAKGRPAYRFGCSVG